MLSLQRRIELLSIARFCSILAALLSIIICIQAQTPSQGVPSGAAISGRITINGKPAPHVLVTLSPSPFGPPMGGSMVNTRLPRTKTNEEGNYRLSGVPDGQFIVEPVVPSLVITQGPSSDKAGSILSSNTAGLNGFIVTIAQGDIREHIDFTLTAGGVITGRVTDAEGKPVIAQTISCYQINKQGTPAGNIGSSVETDDRGIYRIYGLPAGNYLVAASATGRSAGRFQQTFYPDVIDQARAKPVGVEVGSEATGIDIRVGEPERSYIISGRVVDDATDQPVAGAPIEYRSSNQSSLTTMSEITNTEGRFKFENCFPGHYEIAISTIGLLNKGYYSDPLTFEVTDADATDLEIKAEHGASVRGVVVVQGTGDPSIISNLSHASVSAIPLSSSNTSGGTTFFKWPIGTNIAPDGTFELIGLRPGRYQIKADSLPQGFSFLRIERDGTRIVDGIDLSAGEQVGDVRIIIGYGTGSIRGQLKMKGLNLTAHWGWMLEVRRTEGERIYIGLLDASGYFWLKGLAPGSYDVTATIDYAEVPGVTPAVYPPPITQTVMVENGTESQVSIVLDLSGKSKD